MRAFKLVKQGRVEPVSIQKPVIENPDEVLIRVAAVGVCGSEVHAFQGTHPFRTAPVILGHEVAGEVIAVGEQASHIQPGDRVFVDPQWTCGSCAFCRSGKPNLCPEKRVLGTPEWTGGFAEFIKAPVESVFQLPANLSYAEACLIEPLTVAVHVVTRAGITPSALPASAAVLGTGSIGGLVVGVLHAYGVTPLFAADVRQHCLHSALSLGATSGFLLPDTGYVEQIGQHTAGEGVNAIFITADEAHLVNDAISLSSRLGRIVLVALITDAPLRIKAYDVIAREISIIGSLMADHQDVHTAIAVASSRKVDVRKILTHVLPISQAQKGLEMAQSKADGAIKVVLSWEG
ncbi:MAG: alcohol dehydrogenase catalytic domain-containing protein [Anaerolineae bacterium]|nr:alcohol dehydrogenase catalytic domain-containing protein [Anaerolineae bacterium]